MSEPWLLLETSGRGGRVGLAVGEQVARRAELNPIRRHNCDLAPMTTALLEAEQLRPADLTGVMVSSGPGSYTGLRVGVMSAKMLAYATGCRLIAVPTLPIIAQQTPAEANFVDVIADALQGLVYVQRFERNRNEWRAVEQLRIEPVGEWAQLLRADIWVSGPGVAIYETEIPTTSLRVPITDRLPGLDALFHVGRRLAPLTADEILRLEPLYLRGSSAEEKAARAARD